MRRAIRLIVVLCLGLAIVACTPEEIKTYTEVSAINTTLTSTTTTTNPPPPPIPDHCTDYQAMEKGEGNPVNQDWFNHLDARGYARLRLACVYHGGTEQWNCLNQLWTEESGWDYRLRDGIPQSQPNTKMGNAPGGPDWRTNPRTQVRWGLAYIYNRYGAVTNASLRGRPCHAGY